MAQHVGGSVKGFVALMNEKARELGMEHSSFANPNGLDDEQHYSTARDMAKLARAALENETLMRIASTRSVTIGGRTMTNHNKLLHYVDGCLGLKTGYTKAAGRTLVSCAEKNGQRLIAVTLQDGNDWADHQALYEYGFSAYPARTCAVPGTGFDAGVRQRRRQPHSAADCGSGLLLPSGGNGTADHADLLGRAVAGTGLRRKNRGGGGVLPERNGDRPGAAGGGTDDDAQSVLRFGRTEIGIEG